METVDQETVGQETVDQETVGQEMVDQETVGQELQVGGDRGLLDQ